MTKPNVDPLDAALEDDYSDVLASPPDSADETRAFRNAARGGRMLRACFMANVVATGLIVAEMATAHLDFDETKIAASMLTLLTILKLSESAFLYYYRRSLDPDVARVRPWLAALLNLVPVVDLVWFFTAFYDGAAAGVRTLEKIDGNRMRYRAPTGVAFAFWLTTVGAILAYVGLAITLVAANEKALSVAYAFSLVVVAVLNLFTMFSGLVPFLTSIGAALFLASLALRLGLLWRLARLANYADEARQFVEPQGTAEERAEARVRAERLLNRADQKNNESGKLSH